MKWYILLMLWFGSQNKEIVLRGKVQSGNGKPIVHAHVYLHAGTVETFTNHQGQFKLSLYNEEKPWKITIACVGYKSKIVEVINPDQPLFFLLDSLSK